MKSRKITDPSKRPDPSLPNGINFLRAYYGDLYETSAMYLFMILSNAKLAAPEDEEKAKLALADAILAATQNRNGDALRGLAKIVDAPVARPAEAAVYQVLLFLELPPNQMALKEEGLKPGPIYLFDGTESRAAFIDYIMEGCGCTEGQARVAIDSTNLSEIFRWETGRPVDAKRPNKAESVTICTFGGGLPVPKKQKDQK